MKNQQKTLRFKILFIIIILTIVITISFIPVCLFILKFYNYDISSQPNDWSKFSTYISGTSGVILNFFSVIFSLISIYFTVRIAENIQLREFDFNLKQQKLQLKLIHIQNKPYPYFELINYPEQISIKLNNTGLGTLILNKITIQYNDNELFSSFKDLITKKIQIDDIKHCKVEINIAPNMTLGPNQKETILIITPEKENNNEGYTNSNKNYREILKDCVIKIDYEDIFENKFSSSQELSFFK